jgi:hypothetical protein
MLNELYTDPISYEILVEANLINTKAPYNGVGLVPYLKKMAVGISDKTVQAQFVSKLGKILVNEPEWHEAVRELPHDAPDWAQQALQNRDLYAFVPNTSLTDQLQNIIHYINATLVAAGVSGTDEQKAAAIANNDELVVAKKELSGFGKSGSVEELTKKANEYFKRGSKSAGNDMSGLKEIDHTGEFTWYLLTTDAAFQREGKVLQNCIGSHYTLSKCKAAGTSIIVMKRGSGETVVGARIHNKNHEVQEMKGKNNQPPVFKYSTAVAEFIHDNKLTLTSSAVSDLQNAGYFYIHEVLYSRPAAIQKFVKTQSVGNLDGVDIKEVVVDATDAGLQSLIYRLYKFQPRGNDFKIVQATSGGTLTTMVITSNVVVSIAQSKASDAPITEADEENSGDMLKNTTVLTLVKWIFQNKYAKSLSGNVNHDLFWDHRLKVDVDTGEIVPIKSTNIKHGDDEHDVEIHHDEDAQNTIRQSLGGDTGGGLDHESRKRYNHNESDEGHAHGIITSDAIENKDGILSSNHVVVNISGGVLYAHAKKDGSYRQPTVGAKTAESRDPKVIKTILSLANSKGVDIDSGFKVSHGIITNSEGKHAIADIHPEKISNGIKFDISNYEEKSKTAVAHLITNSVTIRRPGNSGEIVGNKTVSNVHQSDMIFKLPTINTEGYQKPGAKSHEQDQDVTYKNANVKNVDVIWFVDVDYAGTQKHRVGIISQGNKVIGIDDATVQHVFKHWDDHKDVAVQLNAFFQKNGLQVQKGFLRAKTSYKNYQQGIVQSPEFRVGKSGTITTATERSKASIGRAVGKQSEADQQELKFKDGTVMSPMSAEDQVEYFRRELKLSSVPGNAWTIKGSDGKIDGVLIVKNKKIITMYGKGWDDDHPSSEEEGYIPKEHSKYGIHLHSYIKQAKKIMGWTESAPNKKRQSNTRTRQPVANRVIAAMIDRAHRWAGQEVELAFTKNDSGRWTTHVRGQTRVSKKLIDRLVVSNLITLVKEKTGVVTITGTYTIPEKTRKYNWSHPQENQEDTIDGAPLHDDFERIEDKKPEPAPARVQAADGDETPVPARAVAAPRTGTKAAQALAQYTQMATDNDALPTRREFIEILMDEPYSMSKAAASTYHHNTKNKYSRLNEKFSDLAGRELMVEMLEEERKPSSLMSYLMFGATKK